ncbi:MAG: cryptochrome/photolyase family protein [Gemmataceae bacterium]
MRNLVLVLGDQLDSTSAAFDGFDPACDGVWMAEVREESTHVWSHKARTALFLSAMRHFAQELRERGIAVYYGLLGQTAPTFAEQLQRDLKELRPQRLIVVQPGDYRVAQALAAFAPEVRPDRHFYADAAEFAAFAGQRKQLRLEFWYRHLRKKHHVLMDGNEPAGGQWNYDTANRGSFPKAGPGVIPEPLSFAPDAITQAVLADVQKHFADHPGSLERFDWPVSRTQALAALDDFVAHRLADFGTYQDAMWTGRTYLYHSRLSAALNLKLLNPREVVEAAEAAYRAGLVPLASAEGFIRQILGWREYVRGLYWHLMPGYAQANSLEAHERLPAFYWTGQTEMNCLRHTITQTLEYGYAHHIQRLMVTGLYALLFGVQPRAIHEWYLAVYVDAVEWVELPNVIGMSQYADGGVMASKPYAASGKYIERMSNYCQGCRYRPGEATGERACPFTTLYWDFLLRHRCRLEGNMRMRMQLRNLDRLSSEEQRAIQEQARRHRLELNGE